MRSTIFLLWSLSGRPFDAEEKSASSGFIDALTGFLLSLLTRCVGAIVIGFGWYIIQFIIEMAELEQARHLDIGYGGRLLHGLNPPLFNSQQWIFVIFLSLIAGIVFLIGLRLLLHWRVQEDSLLPPVLWKVIAWMFGLMAFAFLPVVPALSFMLLPFCICAVQLNGRAKRIQDEESGGATPEEHLPNGANASEYGYCPSCRSLLLLSSQECKECRALFGPDSHWSIEPLVPTSVHHA